MLVVAVAEVAGHLAGQGLCLAAFGEALRSSGDQAAATDRWQRALRILSDLRHPYADRVRTLLTSAD